MAAQQTFNLLSRGSNPCGPTKEVNMKSMKQFAVQNLNKAAWAAGRDDGCNGGPGAVEVYSAFLEAESLCSGMEAARKVAESGVFLEERKAALLALEKHETALADKRAKAAADRRRLHVIEKLRLWEVLSAKLIKDDQEERIKAILPLLSEEQRAIVSLRRNERDEDVDWEEYVHAASEAGVSCSYDGRYDELSIGGTKVWQGIVEDKVFSCSFHPNEQEECSAEEGRFFAALSSAFQQQLKSFVLPSAPSVQGEQSSS